jgi:hypothetical protein
LPEVERFVEGKVELLAEEVDEVVFLDQPFCQPFLFGAKNNFPRKKRDLK